MYKLATVSHRFDASFSDKSFKSQLCPQRMSLYPGFHLSEGESNQQTWTGIFCTIEGETVVELSSITQDLRVVYWDKRVIVDCIPGLFSLARAFGVVLIYPGINKEWFLQEPREWRRNIVSSFLYHRQNFKLCDPCSKDRAKDSRAVIIWEVSIQEICWTYPLLRFKECWREKNI